MYNFPKLPTKGVENRAFINYMEGKNVRAV